MANDTMFFLTFQLCEDRGKFIYEISGMFGDKFTIDELEYWICYGIVKRAMFFEVDYKALPLNEVIRLTEEAEEKRKKKYAAK